MTHFIKLNYKASELSPGTYLVAIKIQYFCGNLNLVFLLRGKQYSESI